jgi:hypothetical protein
MATPFTMSLHVLRTLHRLHRQLTDLRGRLEQGPKRVGAAENAAGIRERELAAAQAELKRVKMNADQKQVSLKAAEGKVQDLERKLMAAQSNREYQALKDQIAADKMTGGVIEEEILDALEQIDKQKLVVAAAEKSLAAAQSRLAVVKAEVQKDEPGIRAEVERIEAELKEAETALPAEVADLYQRGVRQKGEDALAVIENSVCGGCHQTVPVNILSQVTLGRPSFCKTCGRLLYVPEAG